MDVVTTCSKKNFEYVKSLGARAAFDQSSPSVVGDLVAELQKGGKQVAGAYDGKHRFGSVTSENANGATAIGTRDSTMNTAQVLAQLGGGYIANVLSPPEDLPATVNSKWSKLSPFLLIFSILNVI